MKEKGEELELRLFSPMPTMTSLYRTHRLKISLARGIDALIIIARNSDVAATGVEMAVSEGIPCIAYDVAIYHPEAIYVSFDSVGLVMKWLRQL